MEDLKQELNDYAANYKADMPHPNKHLLLTISSPLNILTRHLQDHQTHSFMTLNLNIYLKAEAILKTHHLQKSNNHMDDAVPPPTQGGSLTTTSSSDLHITDKMNMPPSIYPPTSVFFTTNTTKQEKPPSLYLPPPFSKSINP